MLVKDTYFRHLVIREDAERIVSIQVNVSFRLSIDFFRKICSMCFSFLFYCKGLIPQLKPLLNNFEY